MKLHFARIYPDRKDQTHFAHAGARDRAISRVRRDAFREWKDVRVCESVRDIKAL